MSRLKTFLVFTGMYILASIIAFLYGLPELNKFLAQAGKDYAGLSGATEVPPEFAGIFLLGIYLLVVYQIINVKEKSSQGSSKIEPPSALRNLMGSDGVRLSRRVKLSLKKTFEHCLILGPTGAGKSSTIYIPNILELNGRVSCFVTDPKEEIYRITANYLKKKGYRIVRLKPFAKAEEYKSDPTLYRFNLIKFTQDVSELKRISQLIVTNSNKSFEIASGASSNDAEWLAMSTPLLTAGIIYGSHTPSVPDFNYIVDMLLTQEVEEFGPLMSADPAAYKEFMIFLQSISAPETAASIRTVLAKSLQLFTDPNIGEFIKGVPVKVNYDLLLVDDCEDKESDATSSKAEPVNETPEAEWERYYNPAMLRKEPTVVFLHVPERESVYLMPLVSVITQITLNKVIEMSGYPILFFLDEFANIGLIPNMPNVCATARSRKVGIIIALQAIEQLRQLYGVENANNILNNLKTVVVFGGLKGDSAEWVSKLTGYTTVTTESISEEDGSIISLVSSQNSGARRSRTISEQRRELFTPDEVRKLKDDEVLIIAHNCNPVKDKANAYYKQKKYLRLVPSEVLADLR